MVLMATRDQKSTLLISTNNVIVKDKKHIMSNRVGFSLTSLKAGIKWVSAEMSLRSRDGSQALLY